MRKFDRRACLHALVDRAKITVVSIKPRSILQLTVTGFLSVTALLFFALIITASQLDSLVDRNVRVLDESVASLNLSHTLVELTTSLERNARQFEVLQDNEILRLYAERQEVFLGTLSQLSRYPLNDVADELIADLRLLEQQASSDLDTSSDVEIETAYAELLLVANRLVDEITEWSNAQVAEISAETEDAQQALTLQAFLLVAGALCLAAVFTALITRPLVQVENAIAKLGSGGFQDRIQISGPKDLVNLGERLDWLRDRLQSLEKQRSSFLRHVSHELKTPLAAIRESASLLDDGVIGELSEKQKEILEIQINNTSRLQNLIDQLLRHHLDSFSVIGTMPSATKLHRLIEEVLEAHEIPIRTARLEVNKKLERITVTANKEQLRVVIDNLLSNAIKYSPLGSTIEIALRETDSSVILEIEDDGPGVPAEQSEQIFEAFFQGNLPESDLYQGSGLGLAIAKEYVEINGGSIELLRGDRGARFRVSLHKSGHGDG